MSKKARQNQLDPFNRSDRRLTCDTDRQVNSRNELEQRARVKTLTYIGLALVRFVLFTVYVFTVYYGVAACRRNKG